MAKAALTRHAALAVLAIAAASPALADPPVAETKAAEAKPAAKPTTTTSWSSGAPKSSEGEASFKPTGRVQYDIFNIETDGASAVDQSYSRSFARRVYLGVDGQFNDDWRYKVDLAFQPGADQASSTVTTLRLCQDNGSAAIAQRANCLAGETDRGPVVTSVATSGADTEVGFDFAYLQYVAGPWEITLGQNNMTSPMEDRASALNTPFNERSAYINAFGFTKAMGVAVNTSGNNWSAGVGVYGDDLNNPESNNTSETVALQARGTWAPYFVKTDAGITMVHLGATARVRDNSGGEDATGIRGPAFRYRARPNTGWGDRFVDTGSAAFAQDSFLGAEFAAQLNQFGASGEFGQLDAKPQSGSPLAGFNPSFTGGYVDLFWSPTGESRNYKTKEGTFGRVSPLTSLGEDGFGAVTFGLRYDFLDLTDGALDGGEQKGLTLQGTWQPISFLKFQLDYSRLDIERPSSPLSGEADVITMRSQIEW
jgi:phosphate-selective porin OprO and OprP